MHYEWDENKNKNNLAKHGLGFEAAQLVFDDPYALSTQDRHEEGEERWQTLGLVSEELLFSLWLIHVVWLSMLR